MGLTSWLTDARNLTNPNTVIMLIGNKKDVDEQRDVTYEEASQFAEEHGLVFLETSAKTGEHVEEAFVKTAQLIYQSVQDGSVDLSQDGGVSKKTTASVTADNTQPAQGSS